MWLDLVYTLPWLNAAWWCETTAATCASPPLAILIEVCTCSV